MGGVADTSTRGGPRLHMRCEVVGRGGVRASTDKNCVGHANAFVSRVQCVGCRVGECLREESHVIQAALLIERSPTLWSGVCERVRCACVCDATMHKRYSSLKT
eukprot:1408706-Prymnesium_polylepis.1